MKEAGALDLLVFAGGGGQSADFLDGEVFLVDGGYGDGVQPGDDVVGDEFVALGAADDHLEVHPEVGGAVVGDEAFVVEAGFSGEEVFAEFLTEFEGDVGDGAFAAREAEEVLEGATGIISRFVGYILEVLDEVHFATVAVGEAELLFEDGNLALGADGLGNLEFLVVAFALCGVFGFLEQVDAQVFPAAELAGAGVAHGRVEVQVEGDLTAWEFPFPECYFGR